MRSIEHAADGSVGCDDGQRDTGFVALVGFDGRHRRSRLSQEPAHGTIVVMRRVCRHAVRFARLMAACVMVVPAGFRLTRHGVLRVIVQQTARGRRRQIGSQREQCQQRIFSRSGHLQHINRRGKTYRHSTAAAGAGSMDAFPRQIQ